MTDFLRKLFGHEQNLQPTDKDTDLEKFYTDSEYAIEIFQQLVGTTNLPKRLLVIHGIGGVGKSTLLKMYSLSCHRQRVPSALVASEEVVSPVDVLADWASDLSHYSTALPLFQKTLTHYRTIQTKVEAEAKKTSQTKSQLASTLGKAAAKTAIGMAASAIPIFGPLVSTLGGESAEAFVDWLRGFLSKPDMELYLDPTKRLDSDFLSDLTHVAARQRVVLMIDTYEQMTAFDNWMRGLAQRLPKNVLLVIASRTVPKWERGWQGWMGKAEVLELHEMPTNDLRILVNRYYAYIHSGEPDPRQVEAVIQFARGLPMVATTVVQLWVKYRVKDFQMVRPQVVADLVDRLLEGVPQEMRPAFEAAAVLRYFNVEALNALLARDSAEALYAELRRWPFIRSRREGLAVHDTMREMINEAMIVRTPERFRRLHEQAAVYYEVQLQKVTGEERERYISEHLYHLVHVNESKGMQLFEELAEELTRYRMANRLRALLNDANTYPLKQENNRLWRDYYNGCLAQLETRFKYAEEIYQAIAENKGAEPKLRAYALCDWGGILRLRERLRQPGVTEKAIYVLESSLNTGVLIDVKLAMSWVYLSDIYRASANWEKALSYLDHPRRLFAEHEDYSGLLAVLEYERGIYGRLGNLRKMFDIAEEMRKIYIKAGEPSYLRTRTYPAWEQTWAGYYSESEKECWEALKVARSLQDQISICRLTRELAGFLGLQGKFSEAQAVTEESLSLARSVGNGSGLEVFVALTFYGMVCLKCAKLDKAKEYLSQALTVAQKISAHLDGAPLYLATVHEVLSSFDRAEHFYYLSFEEAHSLGRHYYECGALTGLIRIKSAQEDHATIPTLLSKAEQLAQEYEYNDYLTSLYLTRGHITWDGLIPEWESGFDSALHYYQLTLIHALRFNRFLLDEALIGRKNGTPLHPIIPHCFVRGKEGQRMLVELRDWWQMGMNDIGIPRPDTISPIPEGIPLLEAERIAREREPGDGSPQTDVMEQITAALKRVQGS